VQQGVRRTRVGDPFSCRGGQVVVAYQSEKRDFVTLRVELLSDFERHFRAETLPANQIRPFRLDVFDFLYVKTTPSRRRTGLSVGMVGWRQ
jgi:hypothetical protein